MKIGTALLLWVVFHTITVQGQDRSFGTLPLVQKTNASNLSGAKMEGTPQYQQALAVYNRLVQARGDFRFPVPTFVMRREVNRVASINYETLEITLEEQAYNVCSSFGPDAEAAIAFLLSHELTHYYEKHAWRRGFVRDNKDLEIGLTLDSLIDNAAKETEADYLGGFLAYSAGYGLFDKGAEVIAKLYDSYKIPAEKSKDYPSLSDRQALSTRSADKLARLVEVFETANLLTAVGNYPEAYEYYRFVLMQYQSREIYNNLGVTTLLDALQYFKEGELKFRLPIELDLESSATKGDGMAGNRDKLIRQAILHFDAAISLDPNYAPAYLNKACAYVLLGDTQRARFYAEVEARHTATQHYPKTELDIKILSGILDAMTGNTPGAEAIFKAASSAGSELAATNLKLLRNEPLETEISGFAALSKPERIDEQAVAIIADDLSIDPKKTVSLGKFLNLHQNPLQGPHSQLFVCQNNRTEATTLFHLTKPGYTGSTARQIRIGDDEAAVKNAYAAPLRTLETPRGRILVYKSILFILDAGGKVERWGNYMQP